MRGERHTIGVLCCAKFDIQRERCAMYIEMFSYVLKCSDVNRTIKGHSVHPFAVQEMKVVDLPIGGYCYEKCEKFPVG